MLTLALILLESTSKRTLPAVEIPILSVPILNAPVLVSFSKVIEGAKAVPSCNCAPSSCKNPPVAFREI